MKYKSKIAWWFHLIILTSLLSAASPIVLGIVYSSLLTLISGIVVLIAVGLLIFPIYFATYYVLEEHALYIRCGLCVNMRIAYSDIDSIKETDNPLASAGLSLDRIEIQYAKGDEILISPENKQEFIQQLNMRIAAI